MGKKFIRRDGFRGTWGFGWLETINRTEEDSRKRITEKRPLPKKKKK